MKEKEKCTMSMQHSATHEFSNNNSTFHEKSLGVLVYSFIASSVL